MKTVRESDLLDRVGSCVRREIASIGALDVAIAAEEHPGYVILFRGAKSEKQAAIEQLSTLTRMLGGSPPESAFFQEQILKAGTHVASIRRGLVLVTLRAGEKTLVDEYTKLRDEQTEELEKKVLGKVLERAVKRWHVLTAHIARESGDEEEARSLPRPLAEYFAAAGDRVCMRCFFDRPGSRKPLARSSPQHPETYVCAACHDEVLADFPPDLKPQIERLAESKRESLVIEKALGRPQTLRAAKTVLASLSGLTPEPPAPPRPPVEESFERRQWAVEKADADVEIPTEGASRSEIEYVEALFDPHTVARNW
jgi:hypothetical protein